MEAPLQESRPNDTLKHDKLITLLDVMLFFRKYKIYKQSLVC